MTFRCEYISSSLLYIFIKLKSSRVERKKKPIKKTQRELFSNTFSPWPLKCMHTRTHSRTIPVVSTFVVFKMKTRRRSNEENKKITVGAEKGWEENKQSPILWHRSWNHSQEASASFTISILLIAKPPPQHIARGYMVPVCQFRSSIPLPKAMSCWF